MWVIFKARPSPKKVYRGKLLTPLIRHVNRTSRGLQVTGKARRPAEKPDPKARKNFTDPESRIMKTKDGFIQGYNAQAVVDPRARRQTERSTSTGADRRRDRSRFGKKPAQLSADAGYCSDANLAAMEETRESTPINPSSTQRKEKAAARASPPCARKSRPAATPAPIA